METSCFIDYLMDYLGLTMVELEDMSEEELDILYEDWYNS